jgi:hypothetical protein
MTHPYVTFPHAPVQDHHDDVESDDDEEGDGEDDDDFEDEGGPPPTKKVAPFAAAKSRVKAGRSIEKQGALKDTKCMMGPTSKT